MVQRLFVLWALLIATVAGANAQNYIFNRLSISDGLLSNNVRSVWQDSTGYLWVASENGLQRYDGSRFRTMLPQRAEQIFSDAAGRVWVRCGKQAGLFNPKTFLFTPVKYEGAEDVYNVSRIWLRKDASGNVFLQLTGKNCQYFNAEKKSFSVAHNPFKVPDSLVILDVTEDLFKNRYWIVSTAGLGYWDKTDRIYYPAVEHSLKDPLLSLSRNQSSITDLFIDPAKNYWLQQNHNTVTSFMSYNSKSNQLTPEAAHLNAEQSNGYSEIYGIKNLNDSVTVFYGLNYFRIKTGSQFSDLKSPLNNPYSIQFNAVSDVFQDREGLIWVATDNGLYYTSNILRNLHVVFNQDDRRSAVSSLLKDHEHNLWIATWGRGVFVSNNNYTDPNITRIKAIDALGEMATMAWTLCEDSNKNMWIGCHNAGLIRYNHRSNKAALYQPSLFKNQAIRQIIKDDEGMLWIGLQDGRIFRFHPGEAAVTDRQFQEVAALNGPVYKMIMIGGQLWVAVSGKGMYVLDVPGGKVAASIQTDPSGGGWIKNVRDILPVNDTTCLIAGEKLGIVHTKNYKAHFDLAFNSSNIGTIHTLQKDKNGYFWLGGSNGIFKLNLYNQTVTRYSQQDGLITIHNNSYVPERSAVLDSGRLVFGGNQHLVAFDPADYNRHEKTPAVIITGFQLNDRYLPADSLAQLEEISIPYEHRAFTIEFATLSFKQNRRLIYEYKLEGIDAEWNQQNNLAEVKYNFLPHGRYKFLVRAKNESGDYSADTAYISIYIAPPFWKATWFYIVVLMAAGLLLFYLHRLRLQKLLHVERVRSRLARDLHDDMGSTLSTINILSNMALQQKPLDETKSKEYMRTISSNTSQMMEAMDDIVWSINPANDSIAKVIARMKETAGSILEPRQVDYFFEVEAGIPELSLSMETRREIFLVFKEALNNIIKYADCSTVFISFSRKGSGLLLIIKDDGMGFVTTESGSTLRGNGLKNMHKRAANIKGELSIESEPGKGTSIQLLMPIA